jgi:hypothetical protein
MVEMKVPMTVLMRAVQWETLRVEKKVGTMVPS